MLSIDYGYGLFSGLGLVLVIGAGVIAAVFFFAASKQAHDEIVEEEHDHGNDDVPIA